MRIAFITFEYPPETPAGGIGTYVFNVSRILVRAGHQVVIISSTQDKKRNGVVLTGESTNYLVYARDFMVFRKNVVEVFTKIHKEHPVDILESSEVGAPGLEIKRKFPGIPLVVKLHTPGKLITHVTNSIMPFRQKIRFVLGSIRRGKPDPGYFAMKDRKKESDQEYQICMTADILASPSSALQKWAARYWSIPMKRIIKVPNPPELAFAPLPSGDPGKENIITFVGKLSVLKGAFTLKKLIPAVLERAPAYRFVIIGRDEYVKAGIPSMKDHLIESIGDFSCNVEFTGELQRNEVDQYLAVSKICVVPSLWENYPNVILEAMMHKCAVVASNCGGIPEMISHGIDGLLERPGKPKEFAKSIIKLIRDEELMHQIARAGYDRVGKLNILDSEKSIIHFYTNLVR